jgi:hypothetical protein
MFPEWGLTVDDPAYVKALATFIRRHPRVRFVSFFNGTAGGPYDLGTKPISAPSRGAEPRTGGSSLRCQTSSRFPLSRHQS